MTCNPFKNDIFMQKLTKRKKINCHNCAVSKCPSDRRSLQGAACDYDSLHFLSDCKFIIKRLHSQVVTILISLVPLQIAWGVHFNNPLGLQL